MTGSMVSLSIGLVDLKKVIHPVNILVSSDLDFVASAKIRDLEEVSFLFSVTIYEIKGVQVSS